MEKIPFWTLVKEFFSISPKSDFIVGALISTYKIDFLGSKIAVFDFFDLIFGFLIEN